VIMIGILVGAPIGAAIVLLRQWLDRLDAQIENERALVLASLRLTEQGPASCWSVSHGDILHYISTGHDSGWGPIEMPQFDYYQEVGR